MARPFCRRFSALIVTREQLVEPLLDAVGFKPTQAKTAKDASPTPDYLLKDAKATC